MDLKEILGKKKKEKEGDDVKKEAKLGVLKDLRGLASSMMKDGLKATVMAKDKKGLEEGLEKAKDVIKEIPSEEDEDKVEDTEKEVEDLQEEDCEEKAEELAEELDADELERVIKVLEAKKREKMMG